MTTVDSSFVTDNHLTPRISPVSVRRPSAVQAIGVFFALPGVVRGMRTVAFDGQMGASGDMILGALLAAGADHAVLAPVEAAMDIEYEVTRITDHGIAATHVAITRDGTPLEHEDTQRTFEDVKAHMATIELPDGVRDDALGVFRILGEAEARVHDTTLDDTHFHEVGADDAIADVVGAALLLHDLNPGRVVTTPVVTGRGEVAMTHGTYPVPPPAVVEIATAAEWSIIGGPVDAELLTPTGAAILARFAEGVESLPPLRVKASGYGAGTMRFDDRPNVLRATVGHPVLSRDEIRVLETNLDDVSPEILGGLQDTLLEAGARDVSIIPLTMKKSRPGHLVKVITTPEDAGRVARRLAAETGSLGIRETGAAHRWIADRTTEAISLQVDGQRYDVDVKIGMDADGNVFVVRAEYDDAAAVARETGRSIRDVMRRAESAWRSESGD